MFNSNRNENNNVPPIGWTKIYQLGVENCTLAYNTAIEVGKYKNNKKKFVLPEFIVNIYSQMAIIIIDKTHAYEK